MKRQHRREQPLHWIWEGYAAVYGQLKDLSVSEGDTVATGEPIGLLNEPTKYYSVEGPNLYFKVMKDGEPVDPMKFME